MIFNDSKHNKNYFQPHTSRDNITFVILDDHSNDTTTPECPNSIILAKSDDAPPATKVDSLSKIEPQVNPPDRTNSLQSEEPLVNFFIYEIVDSSDEAPSNQQTSRTPGNDNNPLLRRSFRNVGPPKFYGKKYFMDVIGQFHETSGSASNPIVWDNISYNEPQALLLHETPSDDLTIISDTKLSCNSSPSSTDVSLRMTIHSDNENADLDMNCLLFN